MKRFPKKTTGKVPAPYHDEMRECKNCGHRDNGNYCSNCGQSFSELKRPLKQLLGDLVGAINFDASFFRTMGPFLFKPGFLAREYLEGRRKKYMSPVRLYLFLSIFFFFIARISTHQSTSTGDFASATSLSDTALTVIARDSVLMDSLAADTLGLSSVPKIVLGDSTLNKREKRLNAGLKTATENPAQYLDELLEILSYALFLLMPLFAAILMLLYIRRKRFYIEHLLFSLNMHSFTLLIFALIVGIQLMLKENANFVRWLGFLIPVYFVIGMKRFYGQNIFKTVLKTVLLGLIYGILLLTTLILMLVLALYLM